MPIATNPPENPTPHTHMHLHNLATPAPPCLALILPFASCRQAARVGSKMLSMGVQANKLCISTNEADVDQGEAISDSQVWCALRKVR